VGTRCADHVTPLYPQKLALTSHTGGGRSVGIVRSRTKATEFSLVLGMFIDMTKPEEVLPSATGGTSKLSDRTCTIGLHVPCSTPTPAQWGGVEVHLHVLTSRGTPPRINLDTAAGWLASLPLPAKEYVSIQSPPHFPTALLNLTVPRPRALVLLIRVSCIWEQWSLEQSCCLTDGRPTRDLRPTVCWTEVRAVHVSECSIIILLGQEQDNASLSFQLSLFLRVS